MQTGSKKDIAPIPNAVQELTSVSILGREFFASQKTSHLHGTTDFHVGTKCTSLYTFQRQVFCLAKTRCCLKPPTSMSVLTESYPCQCLDMSLLIANSLLHGTTDLHVGTKCTSVYTFSGIHPCMPEKTSFVDTKLASAYPPSIHGRTDGEF